MPSRLRGQIGRNGGSFDVNGPDYVIITAMIILAIIVLAWIIALAWC